MTDNSQSVFNVKVPSKKSMSSIDTFDPRGMMHREANLISQVDAESSINRDSPSRKDSLLANQDWQKLVNTSQAKDSTSNA